MTKKKIKFDPYYRWKYFMDMLHGWEMKTAPNKLCSIPCLVPLLLFQMHLLVLMEHALQLYLQVPYSLLAHMGTASKKLVLNQELFLDLRPCNISTYPKYENLFTFILNINNCTKPFVNLYKLLFWVCDLFLTLLNKYIVNISS